MKIGFIGCGNMAQAIIEGIIDSKLTSAEDIMASDAYQPTREKAKKDLGIKTTSDNIEVASNCDVIVLAVKPQFYSDVISEIKNKVSENSLIITIAPGQNLELLEKSFGKKVKLVRTMPNTPALVGEAMTAMCPNANISEEDKKIAKSILESFGKCEEVPEYMMDAVTAISGSAPAYVFMMIEAMADAAVSKRMDRALAYKMASQAIYGSAKMVLESGKHPAELKDMVTSPGGTTAAALRELEKQGFRSALIEAVCKCQEKSSEL